MHKQPAHNACYTKLSEIIQANRHIDGPLIQVLHQAQELFGYIPTEVQQFVAQEMEIPPSTVRGVVTFYNFFRTEPQGQHTINICLGTACHVKGAQRIVDVLVDELGIHVGETTADGRFTLTAVRCVGACGLAPVMMIDDEVYGKLDREKVREALQRYAA
ncbi:NADH-quinone oxidoreductase subunit NuoE [Candidatus Bipolaricaulota bacterium]|nr:NADH-quinone oxidoreductase subunit NuoE [Candidatus Bipolaricaulota bacterium]